VLHLGLFGLKKRDEMTSKPKPTVSAAIDAVNEIASPLDFSFKSLAELQGLIV